MGKKKIAVCQLDGAITERLLSCYKYCPDGKDQLLSIPTEIKNEGAKLSSDERQNIHLIYPNGDEIIFDRRMKGKMRWIPGVDVISNANKIANLGIPSVFLLWRQINIYNLEINNLVLYGMSCIPEQPKFKIYFIPIFIKGDIHATFVFHICSTFIQKP